MQDRYVADVGDFGNNGLLRSLCYKGEGPLLEPLLRLGIVWYRHNQLGNEGRNDGNMRDYLKNTAENRRLFRECDPDLYNPLQWLDRNRRISASRQSAILPTAYHFEGGLNFANNETRLSRKVRRKKWMDDALEAIKEADIVFVNPDNGISKEQGTPQKGTRRYRKDGPKKVYMSDLQCFVGQGKSLIIYHHLGRNGKATEQVRGFSRRLKKELKLSRPPWALWYHRGTARVYFIIAHPDHADAIEQRLRSFFNGPWARHFTPVDCNLLQPPKPCSP